MILSPAFFVWVYLIVDPKFHPGDGLFQLVVVTDHACGVDYHLRGHKPGHGGYSKIEPDLRLIHHELVPLHAFGQVGLCDHAFHQHQELALGFFCPATRTENAAADVDLRAQDAVNQSLNLTDLFKDPGTV